VWAPGGEQLLQYCNATLELRDAVGGLVRAQRVMGDGIWSVAVSPNASRVALAFGDHVEVRELATLDLLWSVDVPASSLGFSADGGQLRINDGTTTTLALSVADGRRVPDTTPSPAERWQGSPALNGAGTLAFDVQETELTVWDALKDVALHSFASPDGAYGPPVWVGPYLAFRLYREHLLVDAREPKRRFSLKGVTSLETVELSRDGTRLRSWHQDNVLEWRLGEPIPAVLAASSAMRGWLGPAGLRIESNDASLTVWRQTAAGERVVQRYWGNAGLVEIGPTGEVVVATRDAPQPRLLLLGAASMPPAIPLDPGDSPLIALEPGGGRLVTAKPGQLRVYQGRSGQVVQTIPLPFAPSALAWRADPPELLVADAERLFTLALGSGEMAPLGDFAHVQRIAVSANGKDVAIVGLRDGKPVLTRLTGGGVAPQALREVPQEMRFSPDGKALWLLGPDSLVTLQLPSSSSTAGAAEHRPLKPHGCQTHLAPTGEVYCMAERVSVATASGELSPEPLPVALQPAWSAQGLTLTSELNRQPPVVIAFPAGTAVAQPASQRPAKAAVMPELPQVSGDVRAWVLNADRSVLAALEGNGTVNTFSTTGGFRARLAESASALFGSEDASSLVIVAADARSLTLWDTHDWRPRLQLPVVERISRVALSKEGARVAVLNDHGAIEVASADRSRRRYELRHDMAVRSLAFDPTGQYLALGGLPLRILRLADGALLYGYTAIADPSAPIVVTWVSESGAVEGDPRVLGALPFPSPSTQGAFLGPAAFAKRQTPHLFQAFFEPAPRQR
jgi:hypothetical protein